MRSVRGVSGRGPAPGGAGAGGRGRVAAGLGSLLAALLLALVPLPQGATAATAENSAGDSAGDSAENSAVTKTGTAGPYDDFSKLKVTVHQTKNLRGQGVRVTWTGGRAAPTGATYNNYLQIMECWGDDADQGPDRTQCEFGAVDGAPAGGGRLVSPTRDPLDTDHATDADNIAFVPFKPVEGAATTTGTDWTYFNSLDTNSQTWLPNDSDGNGETVFEMRSSVESPHLGCGARTTASGAVRPCWLVVVPRGEHETNGTEGNSGSVRSSALSRTNWNQRLVFPLDFLPVGSTCSQDRAERRTIGSELITDAMTSWQSALCGSGAGRFTFTQSGEGEARERVTAPSDTSPGLGFTVQPVETAEDAPPVVQAPVAVSGLTVGLYWRYDVTVGEGSGVYIANRQLHDVRLNQRLLAKLLTQSYQKSVATADYLPDYLKANPESIGADPEFQKLNPDFPAASGRTYSPWGLLLSTENSDMATVLWRYVQQNKDAREFLAGTADPWGMKVNRSYQDMDLDATPLDYFPKADPTTSKASCGTPENSLPFDGTDLVPYTNDMHDAAQKVRNGYGGQLYLCAQSGAGWKLSGERPAATNAREFGIVDAASSNRYQLDVAALPNADGAFVKPTSDAMLKAVARMPDSAVAGVRTPDPATADDGAYPLTAVVYAASSVDQAKDARQDYAKVIRYAAGAGQTQGTARGELPYGYAPLPAALRTQALKAATTLETWTAPDPSDTPGGQDQDAEGSGGPGGDDGTVSGEDTGSAAGGAAASGGSGGSAGAGPDATDTGRPSVAPRDPAKENVAASGGLTPSEVIGLVRWVLLGVLVVGGAAALAGPVMLRLAARRVPAGG
ncbi:hypothetical protein [Streptomyces sp. NPDC047070]|uniref:hypothetical protein n=1 Tax=Streptomyces sp. NPDC047070 TaxID=3154923 RepID=UPI0034551DF2